MNGFWFKVTENNSWATKELRKHRYITIICTPSFDSVDYKLEFFY